MPPEKLTVETPEVRFDKREPREYRHNQCLLIIDIIDKERKKEKKKEKERKREKGSKREKKREKGRKKEEKRE